MLYPTDQDRIRELERQVAALGDRLADLEGNKWQRLEVAAGILHCHRNTLHYRLNNYPELYPEGIVWRWNPPKTYRLVNIREWRKADEGYYRLEKNRRQTAIAMMQEAKRLDRERQKNCSHAWKKPGIAAELLGCHTTLFDYRIKTFPNYYQEGKAWKWNDRQTFRLINVLEWRKADERRSVDKSKLKQKEE